MDLNRNQVFTAKRVSRRKSEGSANKGGGGTGKECAQYKLLQSMEEQYAQMQEIVSKA